MPAPQIYADHNATTPLSPSAKERMLGAMGLWANPSSVHGMGRKAREFMEESREWVAKSIGRDPREIVFTSGGSEANTLALWGSFLENPSLRLLTSRLEHASARDTVERLEKLGAQVSYVETDRNGRFDMGQLDAFQPHLVSLMTANNETGIVSPIPEIAEACSKRGIHFHTDAVQALGKLEPAFFNQAPLISLSAHKVGGPKGMGALVVKRGITLQALHFGGAQEVKRRGGTENTVGIAGFGAACHELSLSNLEVLRDRFEQAILSRVTDAVIIGYGQPRVGNTTLVRVPGILADVLLSAIDLSGVCASSGAACSSGSIAPSHVLLAMGYSPEEAREAVRFSWGSPTTESEVDRAAEIFISHVERIRERRKVC